MHHQELPIKTILGWKMLSNSGLHRTGLSPGRCGHLRFWAPSALRCAIVTEAAALDQVGRAAPRASMRNHACHGMVAMPCRPSMRCGRARSRDQRYEVFIKLTNTMYDTTYKYDRAGLIRF